MHDDRPMSVVLVWHMHQPDYRDTRTGNAHLPWTYLHAIKDYKTAAEIVTREASDDEPEKEGE